MSHGAEIEGMHLQGQEGQGLVVILEAKEGQGRFFPETLRGSRALLTPWFWTCRF